MLFIEPLSDSEINQAIVDVADANEADRQAESDWLERDDLPERIWN